MTKEDFNNILNVVEISTDNFGLIFYAKVQQRVFDIESGKIKGKTEKDLDDYLKKRGVKID